MSKRNRVESYTTPSCNAYAVAEAFAAWVVNHAPADDHDDEFCIRYVSGHEHGTESAPGFHINAMTIRLQPYGFVAEANRAISAGEVVARIPATLMITPSIAMQSIWATKAKEAVDDANHVTPRLCMYLFLIAQRHANALERVKNQKTEQEPEEELQQQLDLRWGAYAQTFPAVFDDPIWWSPKEIQWLEGTNVLLTAKLKLKSLKKAFKRLIPKANQKFPQLFPSHVFNWTNFLWAHSAYSSRAFLGNSKGNLETDLTQNSSEICGNMCPILDALDHHSSAQVSWESHDRSWTFRIHENKGAHNPVYNNYGKKPNEELLLSYGFVESNNEYDSTAVKVRVTPEDGDQYFDVRMKLLEWAKLSTRVVITHKAAPTELPYMHLQLMLSIVLLDKPTLSVMYAKSLQYHAEMIMKTLDSPDRTNNNLDSTVAFFVRQLVVDACFGSIQHESKDLGFHLLQQQLTKLDKEDSTAIRENLKKRSLRRWNMALEYRSGQRQLLESAKHRLENQRLRFPECQPLTNAIEMTLRLPEPINNSHLGLSDIISWDTKVAAASIREATRDMSLVEQLAVAIIVHASQTHSSILKKLLSKSSSHIWFDDLLMHKHGSSDQSCSFERYLWRSIAAEIEDCHGDWKNAFNKISSADQQECQTFDLALYTEEHFIRACEIASLYGSPWYIRDESRCCLALIEYGNFSPQLAQLSAHLCFTCESKSEYISLVEATQSFMPSNIPLMLGYCYGKTPVCALPAELVFPKESQRNFWKSLGNTNAVFLDTSSTKTHTAKLLCCIFNQHVNEKDSLQGSDITATRPQCASGEQSEFDPTIAPDTNTKTVAPLHFCDFGDVRHGKFSTSEMDASSIRRALFETAPELDSSCPAKDLVRTACHTVYNYLVIQ